MTLRELIHELTVRYTEETKDWPVTMLIDREKGQIEAPVRDLAKSRDRIVLIFEEEVHGPLKAAEELSDVEHACIHKNHPHEGNCSLKAADFDRLAAEGHDMSKCFYAGKQVAIEAPKDTQLVRKLLDRLTKLSMCTSCMHANEELVKSIWSLVEFSAPTGEARHGVAEKAEAIANKLDERYELPTEVKGWLVADIIDYFDEVPAQSSDGGQKDG